MAQFLGSSYCAKFFITVLLTLLVWLDVNLVISSVIM